MISVCIATYNGENYIREQLDSILCQISSFDELVIVDDCSSDKTMLILKEYQLNYSNIKVCKNINNLGHVKTFERAMELVSGDMILLCDQDDVWHDNKIDIVRERLSHCDFYHHSKVYFDVNGNKFIQNLVKFDSSYNDLSLFRKVLKLFFHNHYFGCCMAFNKNLVDKILPFPKKTYAHDHWIAINAILSVNSFSDGLELVNYRQHDCNVTPKAGLSIWKKIKIRLCLLRLLIIGIARKFNV